MKPGRPPSSTEDLAHSIKETGALESNSGDKGAVPGKTQCKASWSTESAEGVTGEGQQGPCLKSREGAQGVKGVSSTPPPPEQEPDGIPRAGSPAPQLRWALQGGRRFALRYDPSRGAGEAASAGPRPSTCPLPTKSSIKAANLGGMEAQMRIQYIHLFFLSILSVFLCSPVFLEETVQKPWTVGPVQPTSISFYKQSRRTSPTRVFHTACSCPALQRQSWVFETESMWPAKPKIFTLWPFTKKAVSRGLEKSSRCTQIAASQSGNDTRGATDARSRALPV